MRNLRAALCFCVAGLLTVFSGCVHTDSDVIAAAEPLEEGVIDPLQVRMFLAVPEGWKPVAHVESFASSSYWNDDDVWTRLLLAIREQTARAGGRAVELQWFEKRKGSPTGEVTGTVFGIFETCAGEATYCRVRGRALRRVEGEGAAPAPYLVFESGDPLLVDELWRRHARCKRITFLEGRLKRVHERMSATQDPWEREVLVPIGEQIQEELANEMARAQ